MTSATPPFRPPHTPRYCATRSERKGINGDFSRKTKKTWEFSKINAYLCRIFLALGCHSEPLSLNASGLRMTSQAHVPTPYVQRGPCSPCDLGCSFCAHPAARPPFGEGNAARAMLTASYPQAHTHTSHLPSTAPRSLRRCFMAWRMA